MLRSGDQPALDRVLMQVIQLLLHHFLTRNGLGMKPLLPDLMDTFLFVRRSKKAQLVQQPLAVFGLQLVQNPLGRVSLEIGHHPGEFRAG